MARVAVVLMVKNEAARIAATIESCNHPNISGIIVYDTGSTDNTLEVIKSTARVPVSIKYGTFVNFEVSRNQCLAFANNVAKELGYTHFFLLDANDELVFKNFTTDNLDNACAWYVPCVWKTSLVDSPLEFKNLKFIRAGTEATWKGVVHEYLDTNGVLPEHLPGVVVYQDRIVDNDGKSAARWVQDKVLLETEVGANPSNTRAVYYLAQTCECLGDLEAAYRYFKMRTMQTHGFYEEQYHATFRCGFISNLLKFDKLDSIQWYTRAYLLWKRAEPLVAIARLYADCKQFKLSHLYAKLACATDFPADALLFVDRECYEYERWHQLGIVSWYASEPADGVTGCQMAIAARQRDIDVQNLGHYNRVQTTSNDALI